MRCKNPRETRNLFKIFPLHLQKRMASPASQEHYARAIAAHGHGRTEALTSEEQRLRERAECTPADPYAIAAYGRFLKNKMGLTTEGERWQRRAVEAVALKLSPTIISMEAYFS